MESKPGAAEFLEKLKEDRDLQEQVKQIVLAEQTISGLAELRGYHFTPEQLDAELRKKYREQGYDELLIWVTFSEVPGF